MVDDGVMAFFGAPFQPEDHATRAIQSALEIVSGTQPCSENIKGLPAGGGVATGEVFMGNVGEGEVRDFTVIGHTVNTAARLQSLSGPGDVLISDETFRAVSAGVGKTESRTLELKGEGRTGLGPRAQGCWQSTPIGIEVEVFIPPLTHVRDDPVSN